MDSLLQIQGQITIYAGNVTLPSRSRALCNFWRLSTLSHQITLACSFLTIFKPPIGSCISWHKSLLIMSFEILVLRKNWFYTEKSRETSHPLVGLLNKAYAKVKYKYQILKSDRVPKDLCLAFDVASAEEFSFLLLLGPTDKFDLLKNNGIIRDFSERAKNFEEANDCDIPPEYVHLFDLKSNSDVKWTVADDDYEFTDDVIYRVLSTVGVKSGSPDENNKTSKGDTSKDKSPPKVNAVKEIYITAFTSFCKNTASKFLDLILQEIFFEKLAESLENRPQTLKKEKLIVHADCVKEHCLVDYYVSKLNFELANKEYYFDIMKDGTIHSDALPDHMLEIKAYRDFHITFLKRTVLFKT
ncbi:uncharacterized protein PRCAT00005316001 [Priceomyces carsonii]|uniref:uncharacterized protein n=1 Tax=Priceomyces carsonii TaxID=28549 RepID=UPI002ED82969|nr:unnamed protein product [Priceomyces carsonii]